MKSYLVVLICLVLLTGSASGGSEETFYGALMGAALGAVVGHNSGDISSSVAIPAGAALGALLGYGYDRGWYESDSYWSYDPWDYGWYGDQYNLRRYYRPRRYRIRKARPARTVVAPRSSRSHRPAAPAENLHPGVELAIVPLVLGNGVSIDLRILKVNGRFIGPRGEEYSSLPTADILAQRYRP